MLYFNNLKLFNFRLESPVEAVAWCRRMGERSYALFLSFFCTWDPASFLYIEMSIGSLGISNRTNSAFTEVWLLRYANPVSNNYRLFRNGNKITSKCAGASRHGPPSHTFVSVTLFFSLDTHTTHSQHARLYIWARHVYILARHVYIWARHEINTIYFRGDTAPAPPGSLFERLPWRSRATEL